MNCKDCINKRFAGSDKCINFTEGEANSCKNFLTLATLHQIIVDATCPERRDKVVSTLDEQRQEIAAKGHTQSIDPALVEIMQNWKSR